MSTPKELADKAKQQAASYAAAAVFNGSTRRVDVLRDELHATIDQLQAMAEARQGSGNRTHIADLIDTFEQLRKIVGTPEQDADALIAAVRTLAAPPSAQQATGSGQVQLWVIVSERLPEWTDDNSVRVLVYTEGYDFGGQQVFDIPAADFHIRDDDGEPGTEETRCASHWAYRDDVIALTTSTQAQPEVPKGDASMEDAIAAGDGTLHGSIDYWQARALAAEARIPSEAEMDAHATNNVLANNYLQLTCGTPELAAPTTGKREPLTKPCRSPYCECEVGKCTHPGFHDARGITGEQR